MKDAACLYARQSYRRMLVPSLTAAMCLAVANLADSLCVGIRMGEPALAAIGLVVPIYAAFNVLSLGFAVGGSVHYAQCMGAGNAKAAASTFRQMLTCSLGVSTLLAVLGTLFLQPILALLGTVPQQGEVYTMAYDYALRLFLTAPALFLNMLFYLFVRCDDGERVAGFSFVLTNALDVGLNILFALVLNGGVKGAIYATMLGTVAGVLCYVPHLFFGRHLLHWGLAWPRRSTVAVCLRIGVPTSVQFLFGLVFMLVANRILMFRHGPVGIAIFDVVLNITYLFSGLCEGVDNTIQPLCATFYGEHNYRAERFVLRSALRTGLLLSTALALLIAIFAPWVAGVFGLAGQAAQDGAAALRWYCLSVPAAAFITMVLAYYQAVGREKQTLVFSLLRDCVLALFFSVVFAPFPLRAYWAFYPAMQAAGLLVLLAFVWRTRTCENEQRHGADVLCSQVNCEPEQLAALLESIRAFCEAQQAQPRQELFVTMAVEEMCGAIFSHAGRRRQSLGVQITLFRENEDTFELHIRDNGEEFDPFSLRTAKIDADSSEELLANMGVLLVKKKAKSFFYRHYQGFNTLTLKI